MPLTALLLLSLAADKPAPVKPPKKESTMKALIIDASSTAATSTADAGGSRIINGLDLSKLPFTPDSIKQVVLSYQPRVQGCHEEAMVGAKPIAGVVKVAFTISPEGFVKNANVDKRTSTIKDVGLQACLAAVVGSMVFPVPPDGKEHPIEFPFSLKPVE